MSKPDTIREMLKIAQIGRDSVLEELRMWLSTTSEPNPIIALDRFRQRYPKHGDFEREREWLSDLQVVVGISEKGEQ